MKKSLKVFYIIAIVILLLVLIVYKFQKNVKIDEDNKNKEVAEEKQALVCPQDAQLCSDGSYSFRTLPNCEFTQCPVDNYALPEDKNLKKMDTRTSSRQTFQTNGVTIDVLAVVDDSRCPPKVQCIWAGTVIIKAIIKVNNITSKEVNLEINKPYIFNGKTITLIEVGEKDNYNFKFNVE